MGTNSIKIGGSANGSTIVVGNHNQVGDNNQQSRTEGASMEEFIQLLAALRQGVVESLPDDHRRQGVLTDLDQLPQELKKTTGEKTIPQRLKRITETLASLKGVGEGVEKLMGLSVKLGELGAKLWLL